MSEWIFIIVAAVVIISVVVMVIVLAVQQRRARPMPGDTDDFGGPRRGDDVKPGRSQVTNGGDMLPGPGPTGYGSGGRMRD